MPWRIGRAGRRPGVEWRAMMRQYELVDVLPVEQIERGAAGYIPAS